MKIKELNTIKAITKEQVAKASQKYFNDNKIKDLMDYGTGRDGLMNIAQPVVEILEKFGIKADNYGAHDDISDGKYSIWIKIDGEEYEDGLCAWSDVNIVADTCWCIIKEIIKRKGGK